MRRDAGCPEDGRVSYAAPTRIGEWELAVAGRSGWQGALKLFGAAGSRLGTPGLRRVPGCAQPGPQVAQPGPQDCVGDYGHDYGMIGVHRAGGSVGWIWTRAVERRGCGR